MNTRKSRKTERASPAKHMDRTELLNFLWKAQDEHGYIRARDIAASSKELNISAIEVEGVVSFDHFFHRQPAG